VSKDRELWNFVAERLRRGEDVALLVVAESTGSSPGRAGYKMAVSATGELVGSIGGGVMEMDLVERAKELLSVPASGILPSELLTQTHRKNAEQPSGMICSGEQTVILRRLNKHFLPQILTARRPGVRLAITGQSLSMGRPGQGESLQPALLFLRLGQDDFLYRECLEAANDLYIVGGGHCALALSEIMSKMDFRINIFDDRSDLNTIQKNTFADEVTIVEDYDKIDQAILSGENAYVVVMTLGYKSDALVIRQLAARRFKYFGVLGSKAKMATLLKELRSEGVHPDQLARIRTPIGIPINSRTPEEIAISIAAEIISIKNS
jgi:xanthine dehydrogenase accessory factor